MCTNNVKPMSVAFFIFRSQNKVSCEYALDLKFKTQKIKPYFKRDI